MSGLTSPGAPTAAAAGGEPQGRSPLLSAGLGVEAAIVSLKKEIGTIQVKAGMPVFRPAAEQFGGLRHGGRGQGAESADEFGEASPRFIPDE